MRCTALLQDDKLTELFSLLDELFGDATPLAEVIEETDAMICFAFNDDTMADFSMKICEALMSRIEKIFGHWKRSLGYRRVRYVGWARNRLELEFKCISWNLKRWVNMIAA